jgi:KUP system potassium uptake protein
MYHCCVASLLISHLRQYIGQAAYISVNPSAWENPFYLTVPPGMIWPSLIFAVLACIVASQAVITGAFQVWPQGAPTNLDYH